MNIIRRISLLTVLLFILSCVFIFKSNAEVWCPFGGVEALYGYFYRGEMPCSLGSSNLYILFTILTLTIILGRVFCSYLCPIGAISTFFSDLGRKLKIPKINVPHKLEVILTKLKYIVLAIIIYLTWQSGELIFREADPCYALISRHGEDITFVAYIVLGVIILGPMLIPSIFCRYMCPFAAVMNIFSRFRVVKIKLDKSKCVDCKKCENVCPMQIKILKREKVKDVNCTNCGECVLACPLKEKAITMNFPVKTLNKLGEHKKALINILVITLLLFIGCKAAIDNPLPSYQSQNQQVFKYEKPDLKFIKSLEFMVKGVKCRGSAKLFEFYLYRDDMDKLNGYIHLQIWTNSVASRVKIYYDSRNVSEEQIKIALTEAYYDEDDDRWRTPTYELFPSTSK